MRDGMEILKAGDRRKVVEKFYAVFRLFRRRAKDTMGVAIVVILELYNARVLVFEAGSLRHEYERGSEIRQE